MSPQSSSWDVRAEGLAAWAEARLANRRDGPYRPAEGIGRRAVV
jgi:hypothetical protein